MDGGGNVSSDQFKGKRFVLYFYPKDDTSGCTSEAKAFSAAKSAFDKAACEILGISRDSVAAHDKFKKKHGLKINLASDEAGAVTEAFGVWVEKALYGRKYMGIERATFLIDEQGLIRHIWRKVKVQGHVEAVLEALTDLGTGKRAGQAQK
jgi:peroxiredoxin Q/BCP